MRVVSPPAPCATRVSFLAASGTGGSIGGAAAEATFRNASLPVRRARGASRSTRCGPARTAEPRRARRGQWRDGECLRCRADPVRFDLRADQLRLRELWNVWHDMSGRTDLPGRSLHLLERACGVQRPVRRPDLGRGELRQVRRGLCDRSGLLGERLQCDVRCGPDAMRQLVRGSDVQRTQLRRMQCGLHGRAGVQQQSVRLSGPANALRRLLHGYAG